MKNLLGSILFFCLTLSAGATNYYSCTGGTGNWSPTNGGACSIANLPTNLTGADSIFILVGHTRSYALPGLVSLNAVLVIYGTLDLGAGNNTWTLNSTARVIVKSGGAISGSGNASVTNNGYILVEEGGNFFVGTGGQADLTLSGTGILILNGTFGGKNLVNNGSITGTGTINSGTNITGSGTVNGTSGPFNSPLDIGSSTANIWNGTTWSKGAPISTSLCYFQGNYNTATHGAITIGNAVIDSGFTVTVSSSSNSLFYVNEFLTNNGTLVFESNTRLGGYVIQGSGNVTITRSFTRTGWHHMGFPTNGDQSTADLVPTGFAINLTGPGANLYRWNPGTASWSLAGSVGLKQQPLNLYVPVVPSSLSITIPSTELNKTSQEQFYGYFNPGTTPPAPGSGWTAGQPTDGWNLFVNPFQAYLDWDVFTSSLPADFEVASHQWNGTGYDAYVTGSSSNARWIAPNQAFFVRKTTSGAGSFNIPRNAIVQTPGNLTTLFKGAYAKNLVLHIHSASFEESLELIGNPQASFKFDADLDAHYLAPASVPAFYSITEDSLPVAINQIPVFPKDPIYVGFFTDKVLEDSITIFIDPQLKAGQRHVWLEDLYLEQMVDLIEKPYVFAQDMLAPAQRFALRFEGMKSLGTGESADLHTKAVISGNTLYVIENPLKRLMTFEVFNMAGQRMAYALPMERVQINTSGMYMVLLTYEDGQSHAVKVVKP